MITSLHNPRVKQAARLRDARQRSRQRRILIDGVREVSRALDAGVEIVEVYYCPERLASPAAHELLARLEHQPPGADLLPVSGAVFGKLAYGDRSDGVVAVAIPPTRSLAELQLPEIPLVVVLEGLEKPGNVGATLRAADGAGVSAVIVADGGTDLFNPNAIRASLGTIFSVPIAAADSPAVAEWLAERRLTVFAAWVDAPLNYWQADLSIPAALVLGSEADGLSPLWRPEANTNSKVPSIVPLRIPMSGAADSLNVSTAAALLCYEARRQRVASANRRSTTAD